MQYHADMAQYAVTKIAIGSKSCIIFIVDIVTDYFIASLVSAFPLTTSFVISVARLKFMSV
jgi:hypothetical protein